MSYFNSHLSLNQNNNKFWGSKYYEINAKPSRTDILHDWIPVLVRCTQVKMNTSNFNFKVFVASVTFLISTLGLVQTASSNGQTFTCSLEPLSFEFYKTNDLDHELTRIFRGGNKVMTTESKLEVHGSGVCRHRIWSFDYYGPITITEMGCYGEITPPDNAVGTISFDNESDFRREVFCY